MTPVRLFSPWAYHLFQYISRFDILDKTFIALWLIFVPIWAGFLWRFVQSKLAEKRSEYCSRPILSLAGEGLQLLAIILLIDGCKYVVHIGNNEIAILLSFSTVRILCGRIYIWYLSVVLWQYCHLVGRRSPFLQVTLFTRHLNQIIIIYLLFHKL